MNLYREIRGEWEVARWICSVDMYLCENILMYHSTMYTIIIYNKKCLSFKMFKNTFFKWVMFMKLSNGAIMLVISPTI